MLPARWVQLLGSTTWASAGVLAALSDAAPAASGASEAVGRASANQPGAACNAGSHRVVPLRGLARNSPAKTAQSSTGRPATRSHPSPAAEPAEERGDRVGERGGQRRANQGIRAKGSHHHHRELAATQPECDVIRSVEALGELDRVQAATPNDCARRMTAW